MPERIDVFISSTSIDLKAHRKEAADACLRMGMFPIAMEQLPASDADAITISLQMCDDAEIYLGIFAHRYGYVPAGYNISVTEMEYDRAVKRKIPRLVFIMHEEHPVRISDIETGDGGERLVAFKQRLLAENIVSFFKSPEDLRGQIIQSLVPYRPQDQENMRVRISQSLPIPPEPYIAHPYTLLQTHDLVGRQREMQMLDQWAHEAAAPVYNFIVAIGGMGKSAITWKWFHDSAPVVMQHLEGRIWWSFYESGSGFENFITHALTYASGSPQSEIVELPLLEQESRLLEILDKQKFLIVFDGFERILVAYSRMDAARLSDDDLDEKTANYMPGKFPESASTSFLSKHQLRKTADPRIGAFLQKLRLVRKSRILVSSRLYPAELQTVVGEPLPGSRVFCLQGLNDSDALNLWHSYKVTGSQDRLLAIFHTFANHPLLIRALAGEVASFRRAPKDFDAWYKSNPNFNPFELPAVQVKSHVLTFALQGLKDHQWELLRMIAAFRTPATYDTLVALLVGNRMLFTDERELDKTLVDLEDRGLLGWDKRANRYDLHPVVRGVVWDGTDEVRRKVVYEALRDHFSELPIPYEVKAIDDLAPSIELYNTLIGLKQFDTAFELFNERISGVLTWRLSRAREQVDLLELLFTDGPENLPRVSTPKMKLQALLLYARANKGLYPARAAKIYQRDIALIDIGSKRDLADAYEGMSDALRMSGQLFAAERAAFKSAVLYRELNDQVYEGRAYYRLGLALGARGLNDKCETLLNRASRTFEKIGLSNAIAGASAFLAQNALWADKPLEAERYADNAWLMTNERKFERDFIRAARLKGTGALRNLDAGTAQERLYYALTRARDVNMIDEELAILVALAELSTLEGNLSKAKNFLDEVWEYCERGPFTLIHVDAFNMLAQIEYKQGNRLAAIQASTKAYQFAWCDGAPYVYAWGLKMAKKNLDRLDTAYPSLETFEREQQDSEPKVDIDKFLIE